MAKNKQATPFPTPLRNILIFPYALLIILTIALVGTITYVHGQTAVNDVASQLRNETALRVQAHLNSFLNIPHEINQFNAYAIQSKEFKLDDASAIQQFFLEQVKIHPSVSSIYFGTLEGGLIGSGREGAEGAFYITETEDLRSGNFLKFGLDKTGNVIPPPLVIVPNFDARTRPWYVSASQKKDATWSDIYVLFTGQDMAIAASRPVYDEGNNLLGVVSVDIFLSQLSHYLEQLSISPQGQVFIIERTGALVATSTGEILFHDTNGDGVKDRLHASDSRSAVIRQANALLLEKYGEYDDIPTREDQIEFTLDDEKQFLEFLSVNDPYGIDWIVVIVIPESAFMGQIEAGNNITLWLIGAAVVIAIGISVFITSKITNRISQLDKSAQALASGKWDHPLDENTRITELNQLASSFNEMKDKLRSTLDYLTKEIEERKRVEMELKAQHEFSTQIIESMGQGLTVTNGEGKFEYVNPAYGRLFGYEIKDLIGKDPKEITLESDLNELARQRGLRAEGKTTTYESHLIRADGSIAPVLITGVPREKDGKYFGAIAVITDLTGQKRTEEELLYAKDALTSSNQKLEEALTRERHLARTDGLTGINNRRHLFELAERKFAVAARYKQPLAVIMFDIDHFKTVNDVWGHIVGDQILTDVAQAVLYEMRQADLFGRYGGEEFIILLSMTNANQAHILAERIRTKVAGLRVKSGKGDATITISIGIVELHHDPPESLESLFHRADKAMYAAKQAGRNCTVIHE